MAWYSDEQYMMIQDSREKKSIAASAFKQKTHCGKGGTVKFPSDYLSRKELKAMNGECKSYRMNDPISWSEFLEWPNEHKSSYIKRIREKFGASDKYIAEMFDVACNMFLMYVRELGLEAKTECDESWEQQKFYAWRSGAKTELVEETVEEPEEQKTYEWAPMKWDTFKLLSDDKKIEYIQWIRKIFNANDNAIANMLGMDRSWFAKAVIYKFGLGLGKGAGKRKWDEAGFKKWRETLAVTEEPVSVPLTEVVNEEKAERIEALCEEVMETINTDELFQKHVENVEEAEKSMEERIREAGPIAFAGNSMPVIPKSGSMTFENNCADDALQVLKVLLGGARVNLTVSWECVEGR